MNCSFFSRVPACFTYETEFLDVIIFFENNFLTILRKKCVFVCVFMCLRFGNKERCFCIVLVTIAKVYFVSESRTQKFTQKSTLFMPDY